MILEYTWFTVTLIFVVYGCEVGYYGYNCTTPCRYPSFGERCQKVCNCTKNACDQRTGCSLPQKNITAVINENNKGNCNEGYYGHGCISPCRYPNFGKKCQYMCSCQLYDCNHIKGCQNITVSTESSKLDKDGLEGKQLINIIIVIGNFVLFITIGILITVYAKKYKLRKQTKNPESLFNTK